jgi:hypothetical protein
VALLEFLGEVSLYGEEEKKVFSDRERDRFSFPSLRSSRTAATVRKAFDAAQKQQRRGSFSLAYSTEKAFSGACISERLMRLQYSHFIFLRCVILSSVCECFLLTKTMFGLKNIANILGVPQDDAFAKPFGAV